jgi:hypothetical protein
LPTNLLSALGNAHVNLSVQVAHLSEIIQTLGWPENDSVENYDLVGPPLSSALDYARENARLTWVLADLLNVLERSLGEMVWGEDNVGHPILTCLGDECQHLVR